MAYTDSAPASAVLPLRGVWIHDPAHAEDSIAQFAYGANARDTSIDVMGVGSFFAGRTSPMFDYGEHEDESHAVTIDVPHGPAYRTDLARLEAFAKLKRAVWFRDNRGRVMFGTMSGYKAVDQGWGSTVSFTMTRAHRDITTAVA